MRRILLLVTIATIALAAVAHAATPKAGTFKAGKGQVQLGYDPASGEVTQYSATNLPTLESFDACAGTLSDCLATKGFVHAVIGVAEDLHVNIIATHLDAGRLESDAAARSAQLRQMMRFVEERVDRSLPTFVMGDLNVDGFPGATTTQYPELLETLAGRDGAAPVDAVRARAVVWSADGVSGRLLNTVNCRTTIWCDEGSPNRPAMAPMRKRLDYILRLPGSVERARFVEAEHLPMADDTCGSRWLSDHKAVRAVVEIQHPDSSEATPAATRRGDRGKEQREE